MKGVGVGEKREGNQWAVSKVLITLMGGNVLKTEATMAFVLSF